MKEWLTIPEAAVLVGRDKSKVYGWIREGKLPKRRGVRGIEVETRVLMEVEASVKRGRPPGDTPGRQSKHITHEAIVYFIRFGDRVKVGTTTRICLRLSALPYDEMLAYEPGDRTQEQRRHAQFADYVVPGQREWFYAVPAVLNAARELRNAGHDLGEFVETISNLAGVATRRLS